MAVVAEEPVGGGHLIETMPRGHLGLDGSDPVADIKAIGLDRSPAVCALPPRR